MHHYQQQQQTQQPQRPQNALYQPIHNQQHVAAQPTQQLNDLTHQAIHLQHHQKQNCPPPPPPPQFVQHADFAASPSRNDGFTVLRTAHGDYFKVYYNNDDAMSYNNYELFSNSTFIPHHMMHQQQPHAQQANQENFYHANNSANPQIAPDRNMVNTNNTNFINQLVENWVPNMSGTYTPFGESPLPPQHISSMQSTLQQQVTTHNNPVAQLNSSACDARNANETPTNQRNPPSSISSSSSVHSNQNNNCSSKSSSNNCSNNGNSNTSTSNSTTVNNTNTTIGNQLLSSDAPDSTANQVAANTANAQASRPNGSFQNDGAADVKKPIRFQEARRFHEPRMIAEVKPMRMSYSDVLSKNVFIKNLSDSNTYNGANPAPTLPNGVSSTNPSQKSSKLEKNKNAFNNMDKIKTTNHHDDIKDYATNYKAAKTASLSNLIQNSANAKNLPTADAEFNKDAKSMDNDSKQTKKKAAASMANGKSTNRAGKSSSAEFLTKRRSQSDLNAAQPMAKEESDKNSQNSGFFYNITKNETTQPEKSTSNSMKPTQRKSASSKSSTSASSSSANRSGSARIEKSTTYQQKRNQKTQNNNTYALVLKLTNAWFNYMLLFFKWLVALVCDVFLLSFGIIWDRFSAGFDYTCQLCKSLRNELANNSGRPSVYFTNLWQRFDKRFCKDSKWAIWRRIFAKKKPPEPVPDYYKNGRLPQTGDEAMYSLLNCKGKDAYSILGVQSDCSQEQIRKHYKKIAVLVHPDKNKQPGAEEAFKILQRAFELIGEPENRKSYDQSVAEALNAEKAWSELNDLLRQLQTKIAEAANTIRCSSCGLRHPRKPTGRPHFAARQCNSCKIRHTAREGDIWAETSFFGLRWKYLALMEGKVLDITEWANCQKGALSHLQPNSHIVQYRIVLGGQHQQQQNQQQHYQQEKERLKRDQASEPSLDEFLDNLYSGQNPQNTNAGSSGARRRNRKN